MRNESLTVLQVLGSADRWGGAQQVALDLAVGLRSCGCSVLFVGPESEALDRIVEAGFEAHVLAIRSAWALRPISRLARLMRDRGVDVAHCHGRRAAMIGLPAAHLARVPVRLIHVHSVAATGGSKRVNAVSIRMLSRLADGVIYCSQSVKDELDRSGDPRLRVIPNGVAFGRGPLKRELSAGAPRTLVAIGRLERVKGFDVLLTALVTVRDAIPDISVKIAGDGALRGDLERLRSELRLTKCVEFLGFVDDIQTLLQSAEIFVMPSRWEGLPISLLEAVASGVPVVASAVGAVPEVITDRETGRLIPPGDVEALAKAIIEVLQNPDEAHERAVRAFQRAKSRYSLDATVASVERLYLEVLRANAKRRGPRQERNRGK